MGRALRRVAHLVAALATVFLLLVNARLYRPAPQSPDTFGSDIEPELRFVEHALKDGSADQMQKVFPEGYFFNYALYSLAWGEYGLGLRSGSIRRSDAEREAKWALEQLEADKGHAPFSSSLDPPFGVFYAGWTNWVRGVLIELAPDRDVIARYEAGCTALAAAFDRSDSPFLVAYPERAWPVDSVVAIAALRLHDKILRPRFATTISRWREKAEKLGPLLAHTAHPVTGAVAEPARGSSQAVMARFLVEIDEPWAARQYLALRGAFLEPTLGLPGIREHAKGVVGGGDVDSGPLVLGISMSATVVMLGAARVHGDVSLADALASELEALGLPFGSDQEKRYAFGKVPVGDAFIVWSKVAHPHVAKVPAAPPSVMASGWRAPFHVAGLALLFVVWSPMIIPWLVRRVRRRRALAKLMASTDDP